MLPSTYCLGLLTSVLLLFIAPSATLLQAQDARMLYQQYCAGCHGSQMEGGSATGLVKSEWAYGRGKNQLVKNITYGIEGTEMGAFGALLEQGDIEALAALIESAQDVPLASPRDLPEVIQTELIEIRLETIIDKGLEKPWSIVFLDSSRALITQRTGSLRIVENGQLLPEPVRNTPKAFSNAFGGFLGNALDPNYTQNGWIYLSMTHTSFNPDDGSQPAMTRIIRGRIKDHTWVDEEVVFQVPDSLQVAGGNRWGGQLLFDREGYLYFSIGDLGQANDAQNPGKAPGKTYRVYPDGRIPLDNPFSANKNALGALFTLGNRNTQGMAVHPRTGEIWSTDHGPMGGDEINVLKQGANYGWPLVTYGIDYDGSPVSANSEAEGLIAPVLQWTPSIAPSSALFVTSEQFSAWNSNLLVGALAYEEIRRLTLDGHEVTGQEIVFRGFGRVADMEWGPDGALYVLLNRPDKLIRLTAR